jgi:hypothetical protein
MFELHLMFQIALIVSVVHWANPQPAWTTASWNSPSPMQHESALMWCLQNGGYEYPGFSTDRGCLPGAHRPNSRSQLVSMLHFSEGQPSFIWPRLEPSS